MKILLTAINAKYIHSNLAVYSLRAYAAQYLKTEQPVEVEIGEYTINNRVDDILEGIYKAKPDVLCFSCYIWNISYVTELAREYHKLCPRVPIWAGGPEVSYETETFLREHPEVTGVMLGEGEQTFLELCNYYAGEGAGLFAIDGIAYRAANQKSLAAEESSPVVNENFFAAEERSLAPEKIFFTAERKPMDMDRIPFCYDSVEDFRNRIIYYESSRGCLFRCSYCLSSVEKQLRFRSLSLVKKELLFYGKGGSAGKVYGPDVQLQA